MWTCRSARITPFFNSTTPFGPTSTQPGVPSMSPLARTGMSMPSEMPSVKANSTWLSGRVGPKHAHRRQHPPPRPDDHHRLFRRKKAVLIQVFHHRQLVPGAEQRFHVLVGQMHVPRGDADHQVRLARRPADLRQHDLADNLLDQVSINRRCGNAHDLCYQLSVFS